MVLAKWPRPGRAKRRLGAAIGTQASTALAHAFLRDTADLASRGVADAVIVACAPPAAQPRFRGVFPAATVMAQPRGAFGTRLERALRAGLSQAQAVVLIGTDSPTLDPRIIERAFAALSGGARCILGPSHDGGSSLIGCSAPLPRTVFREMPWSTAAVFRLTRERAAAAGLRVTTLPVWYDVDDAESLALLRADVRGLRRARATAAALAG
ncbi:MAG: TIGR04282 family arsenosugar biosynthesis glycosyltransferase [Candidatus Limnocylindrales bacterium]